MAFVLFRSSAGSGKTYTLVKEYLKLVLEDEDKIKHTLGITFTNKAAGEMKDRILLALKELAKKENIRLRESLESESPQLRNIDRLSSNVLTELLHNYSDFAIMTIDSFIHKIIKAFSLEIGLPLNFGIDLNESKIQSYVIDRLISSVGKDDYITEIILGFIFERIRNEKSWNIEPDMHRFAKELFSEKNIKWISTIGSVFNIHVFNEYKEQLENIRDRFILKLNEKGKEGMKLIRDANLDIDDFAFKDKGAAAFLKKCAEFRPGKIKEIKLNSYFEGERWYSKSTGKEIIAAIETLLEKGLSRIREEIISCFEALHPPALTAVFILDNIYFLAVIGRMKALIDEYKKKNNIIPISEFNVTVNNIVQNSPVPFIYTIIGEKFNHYLMDEFQDTSRLQWENVYPLIENAMGNGFFNMAVGDGKQSIYRWRGGDMEIMEKDIKEKIMPGELQIECLEKNFRSSRNIIDFNNRFFTDIIREIQPPDSFVAQVYSDVSQKPVHTKGGFVSVRFIESIKQDEDPTENTHEDEVFLHVKSIIEECQSLGFEWKDIAILVREKRKGQMIAEYLLEHDIHVVSPDSLLLEKIPAIRFLIDVLTYLSNKENKIAEASIIYFLALNKKEGGLDASVVGESFMENRQLELTPDITEFFHRKEYLIRMPVYEVIEEVIRVFNLSQSLDVDTVGYLQAFLDIVSNYTVENNVDTASFLDWWEISKEEFSMTVPEKRPAVKIMTIHKAKGLEFPIVIIPFADWAEKEDKQLWLRSNPPLQTDPPVDIPLPVNSNKALEQSYFHDALEEEREKVRIDNINLMYVAFTRAEDQLYIISRRDESNENFMRLSQFAVPFMKQDEGDPDHYIFGEKSSRVEEAGKGKQEVVLFTEAKDWVSHKWYSRITIRRKAAEFWKFDDSYRAEKRTAGILMHQLLSRIHRIGDIDSALNHALVSGEIDEKERKYLSKKFKELLELETVRNWFMPSSSDIVMTESPIITDSVVLRPDRVMISGDRVTIIEYKTGNPHHSHAEQMKTYIQAIAAMGYKTILAYLFYIERGDVVQCNE